MSKKSLKYFQKRKFKTKKFENFKTKKTLQKQTSYSLPFFSFFRIKHHLQFHSNNNQKKKTLVKLMQLNIRHFYVKKFETKCFYKLCLKKSSQICRLSCYLRRCLYCNTLLMLYLVQHSYLSYVIHLNRA